MPTETRTIAGWALVAATAALLLTGTSALAISLDVARDPASATKIRYEVGDPFSGVGKLYYPGGACTAQPISRTAIITAGHCSQGNPSATFNISFVDAPDVLIPVTSWVDHPGWTDSPSSVRPIREFAHDLSIGFLASPLPNYVPVYELVGLGDAGLSPVGATIHVGGYGLKGTGATGAIPGTFGTKREGLNRISGTKNGVNNFTFDFDASGYTVCDKDCILTGGTGRGAEYGIFEAVTTSGDSGSAILYDLCTDFAWRRPDITTKPTDCTLRLVGILSFGPETGPGGRYGDTSGAVNIASHLDWIRSQLGSHVAFTVIADGPAAPLPGSEFPAAFAAVPEIPGAPPIQPINVAKAKLTFSAKPKKDSITVQTRLLPLTTIDAATTGITITLSNPGGVIASFVLDGGAGWKTSAGPKWVFTDRRDGSLGTPGAIEKLTLAFKKAKSLFELTFSASGLDLAAMTAGPLTTRISIGAELFEDTRVWRLQGNRLVVP